MPLLPGKQNIGRNISELHKGPQFKRTEANHGKATADKQAVAVAEHQADKGAGDPHAKAKAAIAKAHPVHLHKLMQDAHSGKFGPQAQQTAQQAMQGGGAPAQGGSPMDTGDSAAMDAPGPAKDFTSMFGGSTTSAPQQGPPEEEEQPQQGGKFNSMFGGR
jgi:hypothetical protein